MNLSDLEGQDAKCRTFLRDLLNHTPTVCPRATKFGRVILVAYFYGVKRSVVRGVAQRLPKFLGPLRP